MKSFLATCHSILSFSLLISLPLFLLLILLIHFPTPSTGLWCYCDPCSGPFMNGSCHAKPDSKCYASKKKYLDKYTDESFDAMEYGCLPPEDSSQLQCKGNLVPHTQPQGIECCDDGDLCNKDLKPEYNELVYSGNNANHPRPTNSPASQVALLISVTVCFTILICT